MPRLRWDQAGERLYETGVDRGVLYLPDGTTVPWNGLTSIEESAPEETEPFYLDGVKFYDLPSIEDYAATLNALTYPDEFMPFDGFEHLGGGLIADDQPLQRFSLSYRTRVGNDTEDYSHGYKIHLVYNVTAIPNDKAYETLSGDVSALEMSWELAAVPEKAPGYKPTAHVIIDSTLMHPILLRRLEDFIYGIDDVLDGGTPMSTGSSVPVAEVDGGTPSFTTDGIMDANSTIFHRPTLPPLRELIAFVQNPLIHVEDHGDGTWSVIAPDELITMLDETTFKIDDIDVKDLGQRTYEISTSYGS